MIKELPLVLLVLLVGCGVKKQTHPIADVTKPETITLKKTTSQGNIYSMTVVGKGHLDGTAEIVLILNGKPFETENLSGEVHFIWAGDWYSDSAQIEYKPSSSVKSGNLSLQYWFEDI
jgi:hypothetical protein